VLSIRAFSAFGKPQIGPATGFVANLSAISEAFYRQLPVTWRRRKNSHS